MIFLPLPIVLVTIAACLTSSHVWALLNPQQAPAALEKNYLKHHSSSSSSGSSSSDSCLHTLIPDVGFYPFRFGRGNAGLFSPDSFLLQTNENRVILVVTDCFCPGDKFAVYANGQPILFTFGPVNLDGGNACQIYQDQPINCLDNPVYSKDTYLLPAGGVYNITIMAAYSPYNGGTGFLAAYAVDNYGAPLCGDSCAYGIYNDGGCL